MPSLRRHAGRALIALMIAAGAAGIVTTTGPTWHSSAATASVHADGQPADQPDGGASPFGNIDWP